MIPSCRGKTIVIWSESLFLSDLWISGRKRLSRCSLRCWTRTFPLVRHPTSSPRGSAWHIRRTIFAASSSWAATTTRNYDVSFVRINWRRRTLALRVDSNIIVYTIIRIWTDNLIIQFGTNFKILLVLGLQFERTGHNNVSVFIMSSTHEQSGTRSV